MSHPKTELCLVGIALGWLVLLQFIIPQPVRLYATAMVIAIIFIVSIYRLIKHGRVMILMNLCQPFLFITLYMQIYSYYGAQNYAFPTQRYVPSLTDWFEFVFVHILRASDILDIIEEYNIRLQTIQHNSNGVACVIMAMHWMVDIFLVSMVFKLLAVPIQNLWNTIKKGWQIIITATFTISILLVIPITFLAISCDGEDCFLWLLDNIIRVADVGDSFQLFYITLHSLPRGGWNSILSLLFRILVALYLAYFGQAIRLVIIGGVGMTIPDLIENIEHSSNFKVRISAIQRLGEIGPEAQEAIPTLGEALVYGYRDERTAAAYALGNIGPAAIPDLVKVLADWDSDVRTAAAYALGKIDLNWRTLPAVQSAIPDLVKALVDKDSDVRTAMAEALGNIGPAASPAIPDLVKALADKNSDVRITATETLGKIDPNWRTLPVTQAVIPDLVNALITGNSNIRTATTYALCIIGLTTIPELIQSLESHTNPEARTAIAEVLTQTPLGKSAVPDLAKALGHKFSYVRRTIAEVLGNIGPEACSAVPALITALQDQNSYVRLAVVEALGKIGPSASSAIPELTNLVSDSDVNIAESAKIALAKIQQK